MSEKLKEHLTNTFKENVINLNGLEYVSIDVFQQAVSELATLDCMLGAMAYKSGEIRVKEEDVIDFMVNHSEKVINDFQDGYFIIKTI